MAIRTVDKSNVAEYIAERTAKGSQILTPEQAVEAADRIEAAKKEDRKEGKEATPGNPVIATGTETTDTSPDPGKQEPTAASKDTKAQADKAKAGTDPAVQKRIDELTRLRREAEEFAEDEYNNRLRAEGRAIELEKQLSARTAAEPKVEEELKRPSPKDFTDQTAFDLAMDAYDKKRDERIAAKARDEARQQVELERLNDALKRRTEQVRKDIPDFDEEIERAARQNFTPPPHIQAALRESEYGLHVAYHLSKHRDDYDRIAAMSPARALLELGKLEMQYVKAPEEASRTPPIETTRAPAPISSLKSDSAATISADPASAKDFHEYRRLRMEQLRRNKRH